MTATWALERILTISVSSNSVPKDSSAVFSTLATADVAAAEGVLSTIVALDRIVTLFIDATTSYCMLSNLLHDLHGVKILSLRRVYV